MKTAFTKHLILFCILTLSISQLPHVGASLLRKIYFYNSGPQTWDEAEKICRSENYGHLAIMSNLDHAKRVSDVCNSLIENNKCWIGLRKDYNRKWRWVDGKRNNFFNWKFGQPNNNDWGVCAETYDGKFFNLYCKHKRAFVCQKDNLVLVKENKTWEEAIDHCRALYVGLEKLYENGMSDLLSLHTEEELAYAQRFIGEAQTDEVWIGLHWLAYRWLWMDGKPDDVMPACPANGMNCGTLSERGKQARNCVERRNFFCYQRQAPL